MQTNKTYQNNAQCPQLYSKEVQNMALLIVCVYSTDLVFLYVRLYLFSYIKLSPDIFILPVISLNL